eukprot:TRINITY_DN15800_c0_g1_i1.p1 TRINITY_DN15800_c0_g1~~TRINITY_DN15800_c0_g1_i1.p1  ORF type:complete len:300 (+),score=60.85 TRINITY_DN15800_c0_g1_i1:56-901(+)
MQGEVERYTKDGVFGPGGLKVALGKGVLVATLAKPENLNALSSKMTEGLVKMVELCRTHSEEVRVVILTGEGRFFCSGADAKSLRGAKTDQIARDSTHFGKFLHNLSTMPQLLIGVAQGSAFGGGFGLLCCCDIVIATPTAQFALSEVRLGMIPATISPYVVRRIGVNNSRRLFLTGERFTSTEGVGYGLINEVVAAENVPAFLGKILKGQTLCAPQAVVRAKNLVNLVENRPIDENLIKDTVDELISIRSGKEVREGATALLQKRKPSWASEQLALPAKL